MTHFRQAYLDWLKADDNYQTELVRVYGKRKAGDARYRFNHTDQGCEAARLAYHAARIHYYAMEAK